MGYLRVNAKFLRAFCLGIPQPLGNQDLFVFVTSLLSFIDSHLDLDISFTLHPDVLNEITESYSEKPEALTFNAKTLNELVWESIDEVLNGLIGKKPTEALYDHLERHFSIARDDIPQNTETLFDVMKELFGHKSSMVISRCIAKRVFENLCWEFVQVEGFGFSDYIEMARARIARELVQKSETLGAGKN